ncbi:DUF4240 domain-containing protein [Streptosporangium sp. CA-115845]|uniref:DUF4240 domain-containing protein n=1 Tax=Streptosporangium sp. CA-115845 TaxID=3240071 RepID=UPI003D9421DA
MMAEDRFWEVISLLGGAVSEDSALRLDRAIRRLTPADASDFMDHLTRKLSDLTELPLEGIPVSDITDPEDVEPLPLVGDSLRYFYYAVIASGKDSYKDVKESPSNISKKRWDFSESELFIEVVSAILWENDGTQWESVDPTASTQCPGENAESEAEEPWWYAPTHGTINVKLPMNYRQAIVKVTEAINTSKKWKSWWRESSLDHLDADILIGTNRPSVVFKLGRKALKAEFEMGPSRFENKGPSELMDLALEEVQYVMNKVADRLKLGPVPPIAEIREEIHRTHT